LDDLYTVMARLVPGMLFLPCATDRDNSTAQLTRAAALADAEADDMLRPENFLPRVAWPPSINVRPGCFIFGDGYDSRELVITGTPK
jgi:hypothetical protein